MLHSRRAATGTRFKVLSSVHTAIGWSITSVYLWIYPVVGGLQLATIQVELILELFP